MVKKEEKRARFVRIVERRVNQILKDLDSLSKCSNRRNYEYSEEDVKKIFLEIDKKVKEVKDAFTSQTKPSKKFKLE